MNIELIKQVRQTRERAQTARQVAKDCKQRTRKLVLQACVLMQHFDELSHKFLLRTSRTTSANRLTGQKEKGLNSTVVA